ncbi:hypothetical protein Scep_027264 [Stephania cephalantha]|uniref:RWP-RK domain-containing protein n=1 Tax=Stephania cephalantha TaxID=152367 RepID=A0AAP0HKM0_9MAGN
MTSSTSHPNGSSSSLTLDDISKHFSVPIADAATFLGVCTSVLKRICRENGIVRWPYRKFLAGKSIEEIQKDAARERKRELASRQKNDSATNLSSSTSSSAQLQGQVPNSMNATATNMMQQEGNRPLQYGWSNQNLHSSLKDLLASLDEFKDGFPSNGLSTATNKWWGTDNIDDEEIFEEESTNYDIDKQQTQDSAHLKEDFAEAATTDTGTEKTVTSPQGTSLLLSVREKAVGEGREALKLGVHRAKRPFKIGSREKLLMKVFKSSLPSEWRFDS